MLQSSLRSGSGPQLVAQWAENLSKQHVGELSQQNFLCKSAFRDSCVSSATLELPSYPFW